MQQSATERAETATYDGLKEALLYEYGTQLDSHLLKHEINRVIRKPDESIVSYSRRFREKARLLRGKKCFFSEPDLAAFYAQQINNSEWGNRLLSSTKCRNNSLEFMVSKAIQLEASKAAMKSAPVPSPAKNAASPPHLPLHRSPQARPAQRRS